MRVFLAGGSGAIGKPLIRQLREGGHTVVATTRSEGKAAPLRDLGAEVAICDALDRAAVDAAVSAAQPEVVINQLTAIPPALDPRKMEEQFKQTNLLRDQGTTNLMLAAEAHGARRLISQSVAFAYAAGEPGPLTEGAARDESSDITRALQKLETLTLGGERVDGVVLRYGFFYGPGSAYSRDGAIVGEFKKRRMPVVGDGAGIWPWIHVEDAASATVAALDHGAPGTYNIVDDDPIAYRDWVPAFAAAVGAKRPFRVPKFLARMAAGENAVRYATELQAVSNEKAKRELGWAPRYPSFHDGLAKDLG